MAKKIVKNVEKSETTNDNISNDNDGNDSIHLVLRFLCRFQTICNFVALYVKCVFYIIYFVVCNTEMLKNLKNLKKCTHTLMITKQKNG